METVDKNKGKKITYNLYTGMTIFHLLVYIILYFVSMCMNMFLL